MQGITRKLKGESRENICNLHQRPITNIPSKQRTPQTREYSNTKMGETMNKQFLTAVCQRTTGYASLMQTL